MGYIIVTELKYVHQSVSQSILQWGYLLLLLLYYFSNSSVQYFAFNKVYTTLKIIFVYITKYQLSKKNIIQSFKVLLVYYLLYTIHCSLIFMNLFCRFITIKSEKGSSSSMVLLRRKKHKIPVFCDGGAAVYRGLSCRAAPTSSAQRSVLAHLHPDS